MSWWLKESPRRTVRLTTRLANTLALALAGAGSYLGLLGLAALIGRTRRVPEGNQRNRFAVLIPAHDEAAVIRTCLTSIREADYPADRVRVYVVADNCTDDTARIARVEGAEVYVRQDPTERGKGYALAWLLERVTRGAAAEWPDAYLILDADSTLSPGSFRVLDRHFQNGAAAVQIRDDLVAPDDDPSAVVRQVAFTLYNHIRMLGKEALGVSAGLKGNGMAFRTGVLRKIGWPAHSPAEDVEQHLELLRAGYRVVYAPEARVESPVETGGVSNAQARRWEAGRFAVARRQGPRLLTAGLARASLPDLEAAVELALPPLSTLLALSVVLGVAAWRDRSVLRRYASAINVVGLLLYLLAGARRIDPALWRRSLSEIPVYLAWKLRIYATVILGTGPAGWESAHAKSRRNLD